jgi:hypothetical protein
LRRLSSRARDSDVGGPGRDRSGVSVGKKESSDPSLSRILQMATDRGAATVAMVAAMAGGGAEALYRGAAQTSEELDVVR